MPGLWTWWHTIAILEVADVQVQAQSRFARAVPATCWPLHTKLRRPYAPSLAAMTMVAPAPPAAVERSCATRIRLARTGPGGRETVRDTG